MKRNIILFLMLGFILLVALSCGKDKKVRVLTAQDVGALLKKINAAPLGLTIEAGTDQIVIQATILPDGSRGFGLILIEPTVVFDTEKIPLHVEEIGFLYGPADDFLALDSVKNLELDWDMSRWIQNRQRQRDQSGDVDGVVKMKVSVAGMKFKNYNLSVLLKSGAETFSQLLVRLIEDNPAADSLLQQMRLEISAAEKDKRVGEVILSIDSLESRNRIKPAFISAFFKEDVDLEKIPRLLAGGLPMFDVYGKMSNFSFWVTGVKKEPVVGSLGQIDFSYYLKPDESREFFDYGFFYNMKELRTSVPDNKMIELAANFREFNLNFSIGHLSPALIQSYIMLVRTGMSQQFPDQQARQQAVIAQGMKIGSEFMKTRPVFKMSILPFRHFLGELNADGTFRFPGGGSWPTGKAAVSILKIGDVMAGVRREDMLSAGAKRDLLKIMETHFVKDDKGTGTLTFEIRPGTPGDFLLNGQPVK
jgi:hypothetical protein